MGCGSSADKAAVDQTHQLPVAAPSTSSSGVSKAPPAPPPPAANPSPPATTVTKGENSVSATINALPKLQISEVVEGNSGKDSLVKFNHDKLENKADDTFMCFNPKLGYVLKTFEKESGKKVFINMFHHDLVQTYLSAILDDAFDKNNDECGVYTVIIPTYLFMCSKEDYEVQQQVRIHMYISLYTLKLLCHGERNCCFLLRYLLPFSAVVI